MLDNLDERHIDSTKITREEAELLNLRAQEEGLTKSLEYRKQTKQVNRAMSDEMRELEGVKKRIAELTKDEKKK